MSTLDTTIPATLADLQWLCGRWHGTLGPQRVEEAWSQAAGGTMSTMARVTTDTETVLIELIAIREAEQTLLLHLRQFSPALELRLSQDMPLVELSSDKASFLGPQDSGISRLTYRLVAAGQLEVDVAMAGGPVLTAALSSG